MAQIIINIERCVKNPIPNSKQTISCPYAGSERTAGAGYAQDYFCKLVPDKKALHGFKMTSGYVEWDSEINPVPTWCPCMTIEEKVLKIFES